ncbi:MAG: tRNA (adenosine(37)-N6)-threonylcarbamoyltransferase complex dimerization subunit type 1 TsaB [Gemmataceae bacterium]
MPACFLLIETSSEEGMVGLGIDAQLRYSRKLPPDRRHGRDLIPSIQELLYQNRSTPDQIEGIFVSLGPGSFTGLRVGIMAAKALSFSTGCPVLGVNTFRVIAYSCAGISKCIEVIGDAQKKNIYHQEFKSSNGSLEEKSPLSVLTIDEWLHLRNPQAYVTGPGLIKWETLIPPDTHIVPMENRKPELDHLLAIGLNDWNSGIRSDPSILEPLYIRASSAEQQWTKK